MQQKCNVAVPSGSFDYSQPIKTKKAREGESCLSASFLFRGGSDGPRLDRCVSPLRVSLNRSHSFQLVA
eukprot:scaffold310_cov168-Amphora_coffeaeformis.AAC.5